MHRDKYFRYWVLIDGIFNPVRAPGVPVPAKSHITWRARSRLHTALTLSCLSPSPLTMLDNFADIRLGYDRFFHPLGA